MVENQHRDIISNSNIKLANMIYIIMPAYNEEEGLEKYIKNFQKKRSKLFLLENLMKQKH